MLTPEQVKHSEIERDATLKLIDWFDIDRVHSARILVVGAGAIGNEVLKNLALLGVGNIYILDRDTIEMSNLSRAILFRAADTGQPKASTAARAIREINPNVVCHWQVGDIRLDLGLGMLRRMDVVIGCVDNREARFRINRHCWKVGRPWIDAAIGQLNGHVQAFATGPGVCYECAFTDLDYKQLPQALSCAAVADKYLKEGKIPTTPTIASLVAAVQVQEALKLLEVGKWEGRSLVGRRFTFNGTVGEASIDELPGRQDCPAHCTFDPILIVELHDSTAKHTTASQLLAEARDKLGSSATLELNFELAVEMRCPKCHSSKRLLSPVQKLTVDHVTCESETCGWECSYESDLITTHIIGGRPHDYEEDFLDLPLADLGIPPFDIIEGHGPNGEVLYFELTGDSGAVLTSDG